jgi:hypothetical protein
LAETPQPPPHPAFGLVNEGACGQQKQTTSFCNPLILYFRIANESDSYVLYIHSNVNAWTKQKDTKP